LHIAREIRQRFAGVDAVTVAETCEMGIALLDYIVGFDTLVLVDAIQTHQGPPGHLHEFDGDDLQTLPLVSPHFLGVGEVLALGRELGLAVPHRVRIFAVEVEDPFTVTTEMTPTLRAALPGITERITSVVRAALAPPTTGPCSP
jgi:hydrogenase maturation protease